MLVIDESGSTGSPFRMPQRQHTTRIEAIRLAASQYLRQLMVSDFRQMAGVVGFSDTARLCHPLRPVGRALRDLNRSLLSLSPKGLTNMAAGLEVALSEIANTRTRQGNIVLITDGASNSNTTRLSGLARKARSRRVRIFTIGVGNNRDGDYDRDLLIGMARSTGGRFASAHSYQMLCNALRKAC
jgi:Ca-activated chloride channel family protein